MKKITKKAQKYSDFFESKKRDDGQVYVVLKDNRPEDLHESVMQAHGARFPNDWTYATYADLMQRITDYNLETIDDLEDVRGEIVDNYVDVYTSDLTKWLNESDYNIYYLSQALAEFGNFDDGFKLLATAQYLAIDEVMAEIVNLLSK